jgi:two-component system nitrogen regulation response regulator NtrX
MPDCVFLDVWMPGKDGIQILEEIKARCLDVTVIVMSGHANIATAVRATKLGAMDFMEKPISLDRALLLLKNAVQMKNLQRENSALKKQILKEEQMIGVSALMRKMHALIQKVAPTQSSVLITGENGVGKELVAKRLHELSDRSKGAFIAINCAAIPESLIESELFGHERGSFTGATAMRRGKFDLAHRGTLFLDEIADMSLITQAKILRILQDQKFERVGGGELIAVDVRVVAATNKDLQELIVQGKFREDLFYRLNVVPIHVPALRDRLEDIALLLEYYMKEAAFIQGKASRQLSKEALKTLQEYSWPGNVRELKNWAHRFTILSSVVGEHLIQKEELEYSFDNKAVLKKEEGILSAVQKGCSLKEARHLFEKQFILDVLRQNDGNVAKAAVILGLERTNLYRKLRAYEEVV